MDPDQAENPPDLLGPHDSSPIFSCFLDCCKPIKKGTPQEADEGHVASAVKNEEVKAKEKEQVVKPQEEPTSGAVVPATSALSPKAVVEFLKMLLSFLLFESLGKATKPKSEDSAKLNDKVANEDQEDVPILK